MNKKQEKKKGLLSIALFAFSLCLLLIANLYTPFSEWYSGTFYRILVSSIGRFSSFFSFSLSEVILYILILFFVFCLIRLIYKIAIRKSRPGEILRFIMNVCLFISILFLIFTICCGINYKRASFSVRNDIELVDYTSADLLKLCQMLTEDINHWSAKVSRDKQGVTILTSNERQLATAAMKSLGKTYTDLNGYYPQPKGLLLSEILSYQSLSGIYSPFTMEANYNSDMTPYNIPFTQCHELSHLKGFMQEEEANFIAYLACMESDSPLFKYSGSLLAWLYSSNLLFEIDEKAYEDVNKQLSDLVTLDLQANSQFWNTYEGPISTTTDKINDTYLKANGQTDGVKSYDKMVDLLVSYKIYNNH